MENRVCVWNVDNWPIRENSLHGLDEYGPFPAAVKIVAHEKTAAIQEIAHLFDLGVGQLPVPDLDRIQPGIVEYILAIVEVHRLLDRAHVYTR
jgi:hypothetical protein